MFLFPTAAEAGLQESLLPVCGPGSAEHSAAGLQVRTHTYTHLTWLAQSHSIRCNIYLAEMCVYRGAELIEASTVKAVRARLEVEKTSMDLLKRQ